MNYSILRLVFLATAFQVFSTCAMGDFVSFLDGDTFDGDHATGLYDSSDQAGPFGATGLTLRTILINGVDFSTESNRLETTNGNLGIDSASVSGGEKNRWDNGESWTFEWNADTFFTGIHFGGFTAGNSFSVQAASFVGFVPASVLAPGVSFDSLSGTWTFDGSATNDDFNLDDLGGTAPTISAFDDVTISYTGTSTASIQAISATAVIPEPKYTLLLSLTCIIFAFSNGRNARQK